MTAEVARSEESGSDRYRLYWGVVLLIILAVAALLRGWYQWSVMDAPDFAALQQDPEVQDYFARAVLSGDWSVRPGQTDPEMRTTPFFRPPGYGYFLVAVYWLTDGSYLAPRVLNSLLGLASVVLVFVLGRAWFHPLAGIAAAALMATHAVLIYWEGEVNDPSLFVFLVLAVLWVFYRWQKRCNPLWMIPAGLLFAAYALMRPNILGLGPIAALWMGWVAWRRGQARLLPPAWTTLLVVTVVSILPVTVRNYIASGEFVPIATYFGENLLIGNSQDSDGVTPWLPYLQELEGTGNWSARDYVNVVRGLAKEVGKPDLTHSEASSIFAGKAWQFIRENPGLTLRRMLRKALLSWTPVEITCNKVVEYELAWYWPLKMLPGFRWTAALFWTGLALLAWETIRAARGRQAVPFSRDGGPMVVLALLFLFAYLGSFLPFFVNGRARVPMIPILALFGGFAVWRLASYYQHRLNRMVGAT
ncbi:MAG TPA: glycosyltransferase family 39 protein, partial [Candidatus Hydrogenedentes bacterium]|nr:glycosyltransferase family 39 protein [Candidatus Hydrogenedentota bacterium]